ncbi:MAG: AMP-binding protein, partial [Actinobacteria bacterium]|nr:AMP-binding protein [Actinomycetota bacterium]
AKAIIIDADFLEVLRPVLENEPLPDLRWVVVRGASGEVEALDPREVLTLEEVGRAGETAADGTDSDPWDRAPHELAMVLYTSGTTGPSKGVLVPWGQVGSVAAGVYPEGTHKAGDILYCPFPPNHIGGRLLPAVGIRHGLPVVIRETWSASAFWPEIHRHGCTTTAMVSAMANILWRSPASDTDADNPITNLLLLPVIDEYEQFEERFGLRICTTFNMTEISIATQSGWGIEDPRSCGKARLGPPGYQLRLVDEHDYPVEVGEVGELVVRTDVPWSLNAGYFGRPQQTAEAWRNGWFHTGDAFKCDEEGRYYFVDRMKDAIRRRGENVSSFEVEREVSDHPDVVECAAIGVPAAIGEEDIKVFVVTTPGSELTEAELIEHVGEKCAPFMVPSYVEFVDELPKTEATERVKKAELRTHEAGH